MITEIARAKLNLALHVRARRPDGYHELETLFAFVAHGDVLRIAPADETVLRIIGPFASALSGEGDNLVSRAAWRFAELFGGAWDIELDKRLPVASGIGGGSADAAATLRGLARLNDIPLDDPRLFAIADALGSDVPACLYQRPAIGRGRGEQLDFLPALPPIPVLLANPGVAVSTAQVFARWDGVDRGPLTTDYAVDRNDLEPPARALAPVIDEVLAALADQRGAQLVRMSGSGATCFALFEDEDSCRAAEHALARPEWWILRTTLSP